MDSGLVPPISNIPEMIVRGVPFTVTVTTVGSGSCTRADGVRVEVAGSTAEITPFDRKRRGNVACTSDLATFPRDVTLTFDHAGEAVIRVLGDTNRDGPVSYEVEVEVAMP